MSEMKNECNELSSVTGSILFREHRGMLDESMKTCRAVKDIEELREIVNERCGQGEVTVKSYVYDDRIHWDTQIVCVNGNAVGFTSSPFVSNK